MSGSLSILAHVRTRARDELAGLAVTRQKSLSHPFSWCETSGNANGCSTQHWSVPSMLAIATMPRRLGTLGHLASMFGCLYSQIG